MQMLYGCGRFQACGMDGTKSVVLPGRCRRNGDESERPRRTQHTLQRIG